MMSISPVQWSFANDLANPMDVMSMEMTHDTSCVTMMDGTDSKSCKMDHESTCKSFYNCVSQINFPTFQTSGLFQWPSILSSGIKLYDPDAQIISFYPELLKRPPIV